MRYAPPGFCVNDFDIFFLNGKYHLVHLQGPPIYPFDATILETSYGHAVSDDLISWTTKAPLFGVSEPPNFDDSAIWTMHIIYFDKKLWMFYTGLNQRIYFQQHIGLALAEVDSPTKWVRSELNPIISADPKYYQTDNDMAWRDPFILYDNSKKRWIMYIAGKQNEGKKKTRGCIGMAFSDDLIHWDIQPPVLAPRKFFEMECPVVYLIKGFYYMFVSISDDKRVHTYRASNATGPFEYLGKLTQAPDYAPRVIEINNRHYFIHTVKRRWQHLDSEEFMRGMLAQPKQLLINEKGLPYLSWCKNVEKYLEKKTKKEGENGVVMFTLPSNYKKVSVILRLKKQKKQRKGVELILTNEQIRIGYLEDNKILQSVSFEPKKLFQDGKVLVFKEYFEIYLDDKFILSALGYRHKAGEYEVWIDGKPGKFTFYDVCI